MRSCGRFTNHTLPQKLAAPYTQSVAALHKDAGGAPGPLGVVDQHVVTEDISEMGVFELLSGVVIS
jgi:hypothetical protein